MAVELRTQQIPRADVATIKAHASPGSEANGVTQNYNRLAGNQKQDLNFLRSL
jgi:hypothetical protein